MADFENGKKLPTYNMGTVPTQQHTANGGLFADESSVDVARQNPDSMLAILRNAMGGINKEGRIGAFRESAISRAMQAYLSMMGLGGAGVGDPLAIANQGTQTLLDRLGSGQGIGGLLRDTASQVLHGSTAGNGTQNPGVDFTGMDSDQILGILKVLNGAATYGMGPMAQYQNDNALADLQQQANYASVNKPFQASGTQPVSSLNAEPANRVNFQNLIQRYLQAR